MSYYFYNVLDNKAVDSSSMGMMLADDSERRKVPMKIPNQAEVSRPTILCCSKFALQPLALLMIDHQNTYYLSLASILHCPNCYYPSLILYSIVKLQGLRDLATKRHYND